MYLEWMAKAVKEEARHGDVSSQWIEKLKEATSLFKQQPRLFRQESKKVREYHPDIYRWEASDLLKVAKYVKEAVYVEKDAWTGFKVLYRDSRFIVAQPLSHYASVWFAHYFEPQVQGYWCVATYDNSNEFDSRRKLNITYVWDSRDQEKYAVVPGNSVWDSDDEPMPISHLSDILGKDLAFKLFGEGASDSPNRKKAVDYALQGWNGMVQSTGLDLIEAFTNQGGSVQDVEAFRKWLRDKHKHGVRARSEALVILSTVLKGGTIEQGVGRFKAMENRRRHFYVEDFITSRWNPYRV